ncbi:hypothetical protein E2C01_098716 [Portunus trituberculatus]|uniref:Uncharacterized protein n=1 Tax=Portunus trituberculatus TaxID=210409 RepID=A0A5B7K935_PORTR|nr:hypothetical protein [Portunus trituberculatus]
MVNHHDIITKLIFTGLVGSWSATTTPSPPPQSAPPPPPPPPPPSSSSSPSLGSSGRERERKKRFFNKRYSPPYSNIEPLANLGRTREK